MAYIFSQVCAIISLVLLSITFYLKNKKLIVFLVGARGIVCVLQFLLLGAYSGAATYVVCIIQAIWFYFNEKKGNTKDYISLFTLLGLFVVSCILTYQNWISILPAFAMMVYCYSVWQPSIKIYRWLSMIISPCMLTYNILLKSLFGIITECIVYVIEIISIILLYTKKKNSVDTNSENIANESLTLNP